MILPHILIVDDDEILASLLQITLEVEGYEVSTAPDGEAALARLAEGGIDLVVLDLVMPKMDGVRFLRVLNEQGEARPPVIVISSTAGNTVSDEFRALGVVAIARKPVEPRWLVENIAEALERGAANAG
ncbi:response regulator [Qipengyuania sp. XHP0211]|uniref:response regulator n=1 Tax=Qipengyuania sp. XHP0211 TaxID=3038079 RepID=UPI00241DFC83|nr:response regulator [Qipengyuania sp. XHP0211]MDG5752051.1 response regulator [Qipengyuania sp. XHP0211]